MVVLEPPPKIEPRSMKLPRSLTTPDLVLLSLLAERPMHGYQCGDDGYDLRGCGDRDCRYESGQGHDLPVLRCRQYRLAVLV